MPAVPLKLRYRIIVLRDGQHALIDAEDYEMVLGYDWRAGRRAGPYVRAPSGISGKWLYLHRMVMGNPPGVEIDHRDGNKLDCRKRNLRHANRIQNMQNRHGLHPIRSTNYRNVSYRPFSHGWKSHKPYRAYVVVNYKQIYLGNYATAEEANLAAIDGRKKYMTHASECTS